jgi:hypothetical protein
MWIKGQEKTYGAKCRFYIEICYSKECKGGHYVLFSLLCSLKKTLFGGYYVKEFSFSHPIIILKF